MGISIKTRQAYSELDEFIGLLTNEQIEKIPLKLRELFKKEKDHNYKKGINPNEPIKNQNLKEETLALIALLNLKYWCEDEEEKVKLKKIYSQNEEEYQKMLYEKYNLDNIFKKNNKENKIEENTIQKDVALVEYKETILKKIINKIKEFLSKIM